MRPLRILCLFCVVFGLQNMATGQDFILENPLDPTANSAANIVGTDLVIIDAAGNEFVYQRRPSLDTPDGQFQGFHCLPANQYLRWPVSGGGSMQVGRTAGGVLNWTVSRMQIKANADGPPGAGNFVPGSPLHVSTLPLGPNTICAAQIDPTGRLQFFVGHGERWRHFPADHPPGLFVPGSPLQLVPHPGAPVPRVYTVGAKGRFLELTGGQAIAELPAPPGVKFLPGSPFASVKTPTGGWLYAADRQGRLWQIDLAGGMHQMIEGHLGVLEPGLPVTVMRNGQELFMTDRHGVIVVYSLDPMGTWNGPESVATGFNSTGSVTAWTRPATAEIELAAVDNSGRLQVLRQAGGLWSKDTLPGIKLPAGSPITAFETTDGLSLTAVLADGRWCEFFESGGVWENRVIATGFPPRAPLGFSKFGPMLFATDVTGRLISAIWSGEEWQAAICVPADFQPGQFSMTPRLVSRKTILNRNIDPVNIELKNTTREELVVRVMDARIAGSVQEIALPPNGTATLRADRDAGGTLEEVYLVPGPRGPVQQVRQFPLPPRQFYDLAVYANRVTYQYIDRRKQKGPVPDFNDTSLVSLGTISLPPGQMLRNGTRLDVFQAATASGNPGAAAIIDPMNPRP